VLAQHLGPVKSQTSPDWPRPPQSERPTGDITCGLANDFSAAGEFAPADRHREKSLTPLLILTDLSRPNTQAD
jgi:hypothetical protein